MVNRKINGLKIDINEYEASELYFDSDVLGKIRNKSPDGLSEFVYKLKNKYIPLFMYYEITNICNFCCPFCYINYSNCKNKVFVDYKTIINTYNFFISKGLIFTTISGGECLMHPDFCNIYEFLKKKGLIVTILTNGSLINENHLSVFKKYKPYKIEISLYGKDDVSLFKNTKQKKVSLEKIKSNILKLKELNLNVVCKMPINKVTENSFFEIKAWCEKNQIKFYYSDEMFDKYNGASNDKYKIIDSKLIELIESEKKEFMKLINFNCINKKKYFDCTAGKYSLVCSYDNFLIPCFEFRSSGKGMFKFNDENLDLTFRKLKNYIEKNSSYYVSYCKGCKAYNLCQECIVTDIKGNDSKICKKNNIQRLKIMREKKVRSYETKSIETERLILKKGDSFASKTIYEYDLTKCTEINGLNELITLDEPCDFIGNNSEKYYTDIKKEKMYDWYIYLKDTNIPVANITGWFVDEDTVEFSYNTHPRHWGHGYIVEALQKIIKYLKTEELVKKIVINIYEENKKSTRVVEKLNFIKEKVSLAYFEPTNNYINEVEYVLYLE